MSKPAAIFRLHARGAVLGVASAAGEATVTADLRRAGLADLLTFVATGVTDNAAFLHAHRGDRDRAVYVGDTADDINSARSAGYRAVAITGGYQSASALPPPPRTR
ncbi:HAD family hydrolase [Rhodococcus koreensis]